MQHTPLGSHGHAQRACNNEQRHRHHHANDSSQPQAINACFQAFSPLAAPKRRPTCDVVLYARNTHSPTTVSTMVDPTDRPATLARQYVHDGGVDEYECWFGDKLPECWYGQCENGADGGA